MIMVMIMMMLRIIMMNRIIKMMRMIRMVRIMMGMTRCFPPPQVAAQDLSLRATQFCEAWEKLKLETCASYWSCLLGKLSNTT